MKRLLAVLALPLLLLSAPAFAEEEKCDFTGVEVAATTPSGKTVVSTDFDRVKNECLIEFVLKSQTENLASNKSMSEKIAYQEKLRLLMDQRNLPHRMIENPFGSNLWKFYFSAPSTPPPGGTFAWIGKEWVYLEP